ncbi:hypothetical protein MRX96_028131 [Rhipicephalus microplus]
MGEKPAAQGRTARFDEEPKAAATVGSNNTNGSNDDARFLCSSSTGEKAPYIVILDAVVCRVSNSAGRSKRKRGAPGGNPTPREDSVVASRAMLFRRTMVDYTVRKKNAGHYAI